MYNIDYFIAKFEAIPEEKWTVNTFSGEEGKRCALGHCGEDEVSRTEESNALCRIADYNMLIMINDDTTNRIGYGRHPKYRIVNYLKSLKRSS